ncbi:mannose-6-phosphate isomerase, class I [Streptomyces sp. NPDC101490]|uniref:mannose-6-phosphate isomerase, class I n=1 Tax=Streptomyces sp. NPDC101490 TaxID=3366143 RepID=UPI0038021C6F
MDRLTNTVRPYAWGSPTALPALLGEEPTGEPQAEMWIGAHPGAPSRTPRGPLDAVIAAAPETELGPGVATRFGPRLPFLLKLLAAEEPLSLQVHPDLDRAREGYAAEEEAGVPVDAPERTYRDASDKPELICALTPFEGLCGFREPLDAARLLEGLGVEALEPYVELLRGHPAPDALREALTAILQGGSGVLAPVVEEASAAAGRLGGEWAYLAGIARHHPGDPGVIAAALLHHVRLLPGEALFLGAGVPHAYLHGLGVEIMANSDNVLRCGLTSKHVDVPELLRVVRFEPTPPAVQRPSAGRDGAREYAAATDAFRLDLHTVAPGGGPYDLTSPTAQVLLCTQGSVRVGAGAGDVEILGPGRSVYVPAGERTTVTGDGDVFRATVPVV